MRNARPDSARLVTGLVIAMVGLTVAAATSAAQRSVNRAQLVRALINLDAHALDGTIALEFGIDRLPTNLLLDRHGRGRALDVRGDDLFIQGRRAPRRKPHPRVVRISRDG